MVSVNRLKITENGLIGDRIDGFADRFSYSGLCSQVVFNIGLTVYSVYFLRKDIQHTGSRDFYSYPIGTLIT